MDLLPELRRWYVDVRLLPRLRELWSRFSRFRLLGWIERLRDVSREGEPAQLGRVLRGVVRPVPPGRVMPGVVPPGRVMPGVLPPG